MHYLKKLVISIFVFMSYTILLVYAHVKDFLMRFGMFLDKKGSRKTDKPGYASLFVDFESLYSRRMFTRVKDCWNRPISSSPSNWFTVMDVVSDDYNQTQT
jgi:serine palmitoyltransferase